LALRVLALLLTSCALPDYGDTPFLCGDQGCPAGYECVSGQCWRKGLFRADAMTAPDATADALLSIDASQSDSSSPDARIDASIDAAVDAATGNGQKYDPCRGNADCAADLCCDSELYQCLIRAIARCMP
jgi:hypothetical protein